MLKETAAWQTVKKQLQAREVSFIGRIRGSNDIRLLAHRRQTKIHFLEHSDKFDILELGCCVRHIKTDPEAVL